MADQPTAATPPPGPTPDPGPSSARAALDGAFTALRDLGVRRNTDDRWLAGVCSGLADRAGIDPVVVRGAFLVLLFVGGVGGLLYLVAWALLPDQDGKIMAESALHGDGWGIVLLVLIGIAVVSNLFDRWWVWLVVVPVGLVAWWAVHAARMGKTPEQISEEARSHVARFATAFVSPASTASAAVSEPTSTPSGPSYAPGAPGAAGAPSSVPGATLAPGAAAAPGHTPTGAGAHTAASEHGPHGMGPGRTGAVAGPERVVHRNRPRGGLLALLLTAGLAVAGYGVGQLVDTRLGWPGSRELVASGFALAGAGVALALVALSGRRAGFTAFLVACLALLTVAGTSVRDLPGGGFGDRHWSAASAPAGGYSLTAGDAQLSLDGARSGTDVTVVVGAGKVSISVPKDVTLALVANVRMGQVVVQRPGSPRDAQGGVDTVRDVEVVAGSGPNRVSVDASVVAGEIVVAEVP